VIYLLSKGTRVRWSAELFRLIKVVPTSKKFEKRWSRRCGSHDISHPYGNSWPVTGTVLFLSLKSLQIPEPMFIKLTTGIMPPEAFLTVYVIYTT
jgi:hypothetical protein